MLRLGLTGGIASASAVAAMLREMGSPSSTPTPSLNKLIEPASLLRRKSPGIRPSRVAPRGRVDRAKLSAIVFNDRANSTASRHRLRASLKLFSSQFEA